jgi:phosphate uptake regulator
MDLRKLQKTGDGTYFITLPKPWVSRIGADRGALLNFSEAKDGSLLISPILENARKFASVTLKPSRILEREIEEKYLLGYDIIRIESGQSLGSEVRDLIRASLKKFVGLEIVEEDSKTIVVQCLIEPSLLVPEKILRRLHSVTMGMERDALVAFLTRNTKLAATVRERDEEVNRTYFLLVRAVRAALTSATTAQKLNVSPIDCLDYRIVASLMEKFGDHSVAIAGAVPGDSAPFRGGFPKAMERAGEAINAMYDSAVQAVLLRNLRLVAKVEQLQVECDHAIAAVEKFLASMDPRTITMATSGIASLKAMREVNVDIADLAVTRYPASEEDGKGSGTP